MRKLSIEDIRGRAEIYYSREYDFSESAYINNSTKIKLICRHHKTVFYSIPADLCRGKCGCPSCQRDKITGRPANSFEDFVNSARVEHGKYSYFDAGFVNTNSIVDICCPDHGVFQQRASAHLDGQGCPECAISGYRTTKPGSFYVLECANITKVGITNKGAKRMSSVISSSSKKKMTIVQEFKFKDGAIPLKLETTLLRELRALYIQPTERFDGATECFLDVDKESLLSRIDELIKEHTNDSNRPIVSSGEASL